MKYTQCSLPKSKYDRIILGHGGGGKLTQSLLSDLFFPAFANPFLNQQHDGAILPVHDGRLAYTTDSFVVDPLFFPGGNIGDLAINGTVNDLLCCGAIPRYLSAGFIIEEGLPFDILKKIISSMAKAAQEANVFIVTGDTKVVERGKCDKIFINTSGIGVVRPDTQISPLNAQPGDVVIVSGQIGAHGICILSTRDNLGFETTVKSDTASLVDIVENLLSGVPEVHVIRDPTRGGLSSTLNEIASTAHVSIELEEEQIPVSEAVCSACELLGLDPLYIANEGIMLFILPGKYAEEALQLIRNSPHGKNAAIIGRVIGDEKAELSMKTSFGRKRIIDMVSGEQLPRIC